MTRRVLAIAALLAACGAAGIWFITHFDRVPAREWTGFTGEARRNPFLALERLVHRLGGEAHELRSVAQLADLPARGVVVLPARRDNLAEPDRRRLLEWVARGGRLVIEAEPLGFEDPMLAALGIGRGRAASAPPGPPARPVYTWPGEPGPLTATLVPFPPLAHPQADLVLAWHGQAALISLPRGRGRVVAVSSLAFARNAAIGAADNATLAWRIVGSGEAPVAILNRPQALSLARWLVHNAWPALAGAALLVALWLARVVPRFGPVAPDPPPTRRRLLDHLLAAGRFHWSTRRADHLVEAAREAALLRLARLRPDFAALAPPGRERFLVSALGLSAEEARAVVSGTPHVRTQADVMRAIALYQAIHERAAIRPHRGA